MPLRPMYSPISALPATNSAEVTAAATHTSRQWMRARGIAHHILTPEHTAASTNLQEAARQCEFKHQVLDAAAIRTLEPAFSSEAKLSGALYYPDDQAGNCVLFAKQMRNAAQALAHWRAQSPACTPAGGRPASMHNSSLQPSTCAARS